MVSSHSFRLNARGYNDVHDITSPVADAVRSSSIGNGVVTVFVPGSTAGITTIEFESGAVNDLKKAIDRLVPHDIPYDHDRRWDDGNGFSHVRAALLGPSLSIPLTNGELQLGTWQQIVLIDFDNRPRTRTISVQIVGE
jgi:secondary thiamine-phosphate synthase enzyme